VIIDSQVHVYSVESLNGRPPSQFIAEVTGDQMVAAMDEVGVDGAICVSPWSIYHDDTSFVEQVYRDHPSRFRLMAPIDVHAESVSAKLDAWVSTPGAAGVRVLDRSLEGIGAPIEADDPNVINVVERASAAGFPINLMCSGRLSLITKLAAAFPDAQFVLDHLGIVQPHHPPAPADVFDDIPAVVALARYPNIAVKVSGTGTYSSQPFPYKDLWDPVGRIIDAFGIDRCMWGTDWTRTLKFLTYEQGVESFSQHWPMSDTDRESLMGATTMRIYRWLERGEP